jgi:hypothetical protein
MASVGGEPGGGEPSGANVGESSSVPLIVLVFDMDQTLIDTNKDNNAAMSHHKKIPSLLNTRLLEEVISPAVRLRNQGRNIAILLLTNNGDEEYIKAVMSEINNRIFDLHIRSNLQMRDNIKNFNEYFKEKEKEKDARPVFDAFMTAKTPGRYAKEFVKDLEDVKLMLQTARLPYDIKQLVSNTYMFDDMPEHKIKSEIQPGNYFYIVSKKGEGGFTVDGGDATDYSKIKGVLESLNNPVDGSDNTNGNLKLLNKSVGGRRRRSLRRRNKKSKKTKKRSTRSLHGVGRSVKQRQVKQWQVKQRQVKQWQVKQHGGGQYCPKRLDGKIVDYVYCAAECDTDNTCGPYT